MARDEEEELLAADDRELPYVLDLDEFDEVDINEVIRILNA
ncbi:hypothetical protein [Rhizobium ruizarguesonis]